MLQKHWRTCASSINIQARVGERVQSKFEQNNLNSHEPWQASNTTHDLNRPLCDVGDHMLKCCVRGDRSDGRTRAARESVMRFLFWVVCAHGTSIVGTLQVEPDLVAQAKETLTPC